MSFIDVGYGDAIYIQDETGFDVLIDGGNPFAGPLVIEYLQEQGVDELDVMIATHAHRDHIGGLIEFLQETDIPVHQVLYNGQPSDTEIWASFVEAVRARGLTLTAAQFPMTYTWGTTTSYVLNPISDLPNFTQTDDNQNNASVVILLEFVDINFMFTGDIGALVETDILSLGTLIEADILKVAHHGCSDSSSATFLAAVNPAEAIISVGESPSGFPDGGTLDRLLAAGARIWRTDQSGTIVVLSDGVSYSINGFLPLGYQIFLPIVVEMLL